MTGKVLIFILMLFSILVKGQGQNNTIDSSQLSTKSCCQNYQSGKECEEHAQFAIDGFIDAYYSYDFADPTGNQKPSFFYNHTRHNELSLNLGLIRMNYNGEKSRGVIGLMAGTYAQYNLAHEQNLLQHVFEAHGGVELYDDLWLDAGVFGSHLGFESAISSENITLTRSMMAENSPYYLSGAKISYEGVEKWTFLAVVSNGWQNIREANGNKNKALGGQVVFEPSDKLLINYSNWWSDESVSKNPVIDPRGNRIFNDLYAIITPTDKMKIITAFDFGMEEYIPVVSSKEWNIWYAPALLIGYDWCEKFSTGVRGEYYVDENGVIIQNDFAVLGISFNTDYHPSDNAVLRVEAKWLQSSTPIFEQPDFTYSNSNLAITTSLAISFGK